MTYLIRLYLLTSIIMITACSNHQHTVDNWPKDIPPRTYFTNYYQQDEAHQSVLKQTDYLVWIQRFYLGWELYRRGWLKATEELAITLDTQQKQNEIRKKMLFAGRLIAPEWAKKSGYRVINTSHVAIWGNNLRTSIKRKEQMIMLDTILRDITGLLDRSIDPSTITAERYYVSEPFGADIDF